jgi:type IV pilus assembly protein PilM
MFNSKSFLCLDFGAGSVKAAEFQIDHANALSLKRYGVEALGLEGSQESKREKAVLTAVQRLLARGFGGGPANICAPGFQVFSKFLKLPPVDNAKVRQIIQYEAQQNIPYPLEEAVWDFQLTGTSAGGEVEALLVAMKADVVERIFRTAEAAGLKLQIVDASPSALCNAFRYNYGDLEGCTLLVDIGAKTSNVLLFEKGKVFARSINIGANAITQEFAGEAKIPFAKAEELKISDGSVGLGGAYEDPENPNEAAISKIARQVMTRLHIQVNQTIQFYRGQQGGSAPVRMFLAGGASIMPFAREFFAEKLNIPVEYFNPFRNVAIDPEIDVNELAKVAHSFGEVVGLALRNLARCPVELNLVPKSIRKKQAFEQRKPYFAAAVASLVMVVFAIGFFYSKSAAIKRESLAQLNHQLEPLKHRADEMDKQLNSLKRAQQEMDAYTSVIKDRFFWPEELVEMRNLLVKVEERSGRPGRDVGVWIEKFGTVENPEDDDVPMTATAGAVFGTVEWAKLHPAEAKRYMPMLYDYLVKIGQIKPGADTETPLVFKTQTANTNLVTINVQFRAVSLSNANDPAANGRLAFAIAEEFKKSPYFDPEGTKLSGALEEPEPIGQNAATFRFGMTLKLKNEMQL